MWPSDPIGVAFHPIGVAFRNGLYSRKGERRKIKGESRFTPPDNKLFKAPHPQVLRKKMAHKRDGARLKVVQKKSWQG